MYIVQVPLVLNKVVAETKLLFTQDSLFSTYCTVINDDRGPNYIQSSHLSYGIHSAQ